MKKLNLIINIVLVVAVGVLFFLHFTGNKEEIKPAVKKDNIPSVTATDHLPIAYVRIDTLLNNMKMYTDLTDKLTAKQQKLEASFTSQYKAFEKEIADYQSKVSKGLLLRSEAQELEAGLSNKQLELENQRNSYLAELQEEGLVSQNKVINYIMEYLKEYNSDNTYSYIFSYSFGGGLLYVNEGSDITKEVLEGINKKYSEEQPSK